MTTILQTTGAKLSPEQMLLVLDQVKLGIGFGKHHGRFAMNERVIEWDLREVLAAEAACDESGEP